jgi:hypothetical protein
MVWYGVEEGVSVVVRGEEGSHKEGHKDGWLCLGERKTHRHKPQTTACSSAQPALPPAPFSHPHQPHFPPKFKQGLPKEKERRYGSFEAWEMELTQQRNSLEIVMKALYWLEQKFRDIFQQKTIGNFFSFVFQ